MFKFTVKLFKICDFFSDYIHYILSDIINFHFCMLGNERDLKLTYL